MCDPLTIASAAATVIGTGMQMKAQSNARKETERVMSRNAEKQDALRKDSQTKLMDVAKNYDRENYDAEQAEATQVMADKFAAGTGEGVLPGGEYSVPQTTSSNTTRYADKKKGENDAYLQEYQKGLAKLRGFTQNAAAQRRDVGRTGEQMQLNSEFMRGNEAILPMQIQAAQSKANSPLGDILTAAGGAGLTYGLSAPTTGTTVFVPGKGIPGYPTQAAADAAAKKMGIVWNKG